MKTQVQMVIYLDTQASFRIAISQETANPPPSLHYTKRALIYL